MIQSAQFFGSYLYLVFAVVAVSLFLLVKSSLAMIFRKRILPFIPFFMIGLVLSLVAGFMFYNLFDLALDVFTGGRFVFIVGIFYLLWRWQSD